jgi:glucose/mannose-6-phosphate isomerase
MSTVDLDDIAYLERFDPGNMGQRIAELPRQCREATALVRKCPLPDDYRAAETIVIVGLGGSAIGGDLLRTLVRGECAVPILVNRAYDLPAFVSERTLVVASSYSGNTEETLSALNQALDRGAMCSAITRGGQLAEMCRKKGLPLITFDYDSQPRAALGYSFMILFTLLQNLGYVSDRSTQLEDALRSLQRLGSQLPPGVPEAENPAKQLARRLEGRLAVIYGAEHLSQVARRWKCQLNENSKSWAFWEVLPELNHNAVAGYQFPASLAPHLHVLMLASDLYQPRLQVRLQVTGEVLTQSGISHEAIQVQGQSRFSQLLWAVHLVDFVSYYLAALNGVDPTPIDTITYLRQRLAQMPSA